MKSIKLADLEKLCELFECTPNDLLEWTPGKYVDDPTKHPLHELTREEKPVNIKELLSTIPVARIAEIEQFILEKTKKE